MCILDDDGGLLAAPARFAKIKAISKGWSNNKKYYMEADNGKQMLLRFQPPAP